MLLDFESSRLGHCNRCQKPDTSIDVACTPLPMKKPLFPKCRDEFCVVSWSQKLNFSAKVFPRPSTTTEECVMCSWSIYHTSPNLVGDWWTITQLINEKLEFHWCLKISYFVLWGLRKLTLRLVTPSKYTMTIFLQSQIWNWPRIEKNSSYINKKNLQYINKIH